LTPAIMAVVCDGVRAGRSESGLIRELGIHPSRYYRWLTDGSKGLEPYASLRSQLLKAREHAQKSRVLRQIDLHELGLRVIVERARPLEPDRTRRASKRRRETDAVMPAVRAADPAVVERYTETP
jgi:hypothetical protein